MKKENTIYCLLLFLTVSFSVVAQQQVKNVIFLIGDGMGFNQVHAAMTANGNKLQLERCPYTGISKTYSFKDYTTDSAAGGTALACGVKTTNGMIGMRPDSSAINSMLVESKQNGKSTGIVVSCAVTHATPASFYAHQINRSMEDEIASELLRGDVDVCIGGGRDHFVKRKDAQNYEQLLTQKGFSIVHQLADFKNIKTPKVIGLLADGHLPTVSEGRGKYLPEATAHTIELLNSNEKGFFLMIEGSQIDWAGHQNDPSYLISEMLDFDQTVAVALDFAEKDGNTLVIITADHETGGLAISTGSFADKNINVVYTTKNHSASPVPVFAFGPGADQFSGYMENSSIKDKISNLLQEEKKKHEN